MASAKSFDLCVRRIHEAPLAGDWTAAAAALADVIGSDRLIVYGEGAPGSRRPFFVHGEDGIFDRMADAMCGSLAPKWIERLPPGDVVRSSDKIGDRDFERSAFYNEAIRPIGDFYGVLAGLRRSSGGRAYVASGRRRGRRDFGDTALLRLQQLLPHLAVGLSTSEILAEVELRSASADMVLERLDVAMLLLDVRGRLVFANRKADRMLTDGSLSLANGANEPFDGAGSVRRAAMRCAQYGTASTVEWTGADGLNFRAQVAPAPDSASLERLAKSGAVLVIVSSIGRESADCADTVRRRFNLTAAEVAVAMEIANGSGRRAASERLGVSLSTVRTHLTHIFEKTGVHRQAELAALVARLSARN